MAISLCLALLLLSYLPLFCCLADCKRSCCLPAAGCPVPQHSAYEEGTAQQAGAVAVRCPAQQSLTACGPVQVDFNAKNEYDMINNYKVMQDVFNKLGVEKVRKQHQHIQQQL
jgi:hypothetical protein